MTVRSEDPRPRRPSPEPFPEVTREEWRARVERELGERDFAAELVSTLPGGLTVEPLYSERPWEATADPGTDPQGIPGRAPFVRGSRPAAAAGAWLRCARCELGPEPSSAELRSAAEALADDLGGGCNAALLSLASPEPLAELLAAVPLPETAIFLDSRPPAAGDPDFAIAAVLLSSLEERRVAADAAVLGLGADPIAALAAAGGDAGALGEAERALGELAVRCRAEWPRTRAIAVSSLPFHESGAHPVQELGWTLATLAHYLRACERGGLAPEEAAAGIELRVAMESDTFLGIAKLRALRSLWSRLLAACGVARPPAPWVHAFSSERSLTRRGARLNLARVATQTLAAVCGGADAISAAPWDRARREGSGAGLGPGPGSGRRLARNTQLILAAEAHLGRAADPAGGSYYLESLTDRLARGGWEELRRIERAGGIAEHLFSGRLRAEVDAGWEQRASAVRAGELPVVGVTVYPDPDEGPAAGGTAEQEEPAAEERGDEVAIEPLPRRRDEEAAAAAAEVPP